MTGAQLTGQDGIDRLRVKNEGQSRVRHPGLANHRAIPHGAVLTRIEGCIEIFRFQFRGADEFFCGLVFARVLAALLRVL